MARTMGLNYDWVIPKYRRDTAIWAEEDGGGCKVGIENFACSTNPG